MLFGSEGVAISTMPSGLQCLLQAEADIAESARQARLVFEQEAKRFEREFSYAAERNALEVNTFADDFHSMFAIYQFLF